MKRSLRITIIILLIILLSGCTSSVSESPKFKNPKSKYVGDYKSDKLYTEIENIENCTDPEKLVKILGDIYGSKFNFEKLEYDEKTKTNNFEGSDLGIVVGIEGFYKMREDPIAKPEVYLFFKVLNDGVEDINSEIPTFIMDKYGSYLVEKYEYQNSDLDNKEKLYITSWSTVDLYMCQRGFIEGDKNREFYSRWAGEMKFFLEFENLINEYLLSKDGNNEHENINMKEEDATENNNIEQDSTYETKTDSNYEEDEIDELSIIKKIDICTSPDELCDILFKIYNCEFKYDSLHWDYSYNRYKSDNFDSYYIGRLYTYQRPKIVNQNIISDKAYLFYRAFYIKGEKEPRFSKYPLFIMDDKGTYIIIEDKNSFINVWSVLDLYAGSNGLYKGIYPNEIQMYKELIKAFKNTVEVTDFFDKVKEYSDTYNHN